MTSVLVYISARAICGGPYIYIYVYMGHLLKTGQNCDIEGKNSECEFFNAIIWK